ncbi:MAG: bifunctional phosphopantothenoylcysteine decarboxylase/phosphopantothenate--cysteine ligase CoaBC [Gammaproteobacteria bacterium]|nr:MAG: bifunctional phosphopantothenoylcysteine decarboxylase/phosphopantothenate--cysteine ligase CoaBC [Gammaproteobacteria bacterium]
MEWIVLKKILIGITGSIAAYKIADLTRLLKKSGHEVRVVMTKSATHIISPMTLQVLSHHEVRCDLFNHQDEAKIDHIALARWAEQIIIAPATAHFMAKLAHGLADDLLSTICLATDKPIAIAPAMNRLMWENSATQSNLSTLLARGFQLIEPEQGEQACGETGIGRMAEPQTIMAWLQQSDSKPLLGEKMVITAGPTIERIDPVRFISNDSSGKMGYALAEKAQALGAKVTLITGKTALSSPSGVTRIAVESAREMLAAVMQHIEDADWFIATAAVADYRLETPSEQKIKKQDDNGLTLKLVQNPDILASVCALPNPPFTVGFAAESENVIANGKQKRLKKGADLIAANDIAQKNIGFNSEDNAVTLIGENFQQSFEKMPKKQLAERLLLTGLEFKNKKYSGR